MGVAHPLAYSLWHFPKANSKHISNAQTAFLVRETPPDNLDSQLLGRRFSEQRHRPNNPPFEGGKGPYGFAGNVDPSPPYQGAGRGQAFQRFRGSNGREEPIGQAFQRRANGGGTGYG